MLGSITISHLLQALSQALDGDATARVAGKALDAAAGKADAPAADAEVHAAAQSPQSPQSPQSEDQLRQAGLLINELLDLHEADLARLGKARDEVDELRFALEVQRANSREMSIPLIEVWPHVVCLPLIGAVDKVRSKEIMEKLLVAVSEHKAKLVIVDITTLMRINPATAQHLLALAQAVRLLGGEFAISGMSPQVASMMVAQGLDFRALRCTRTLYDALTGYLSTAAPPGSPQRPTSLGGDGKAPSMRR